jgi:hypothetical protein
VEAVVDRGLALGLGVPGVEAGPQRAALLLDREVDDRRGAAVGRGDGAGLEVVRRGGAAERQSMWVWASMPPGRTYWPRGVDRLIGLAEAARCEGWVSATMRSPSIQTSAPKVSLAVTTVPFLMSVRVMALLHPHGHGQPIRGPYASGRRSRKNCQVRRTSSIRSRSSVGHHQLVLVLASRRR